MAITVDIVEQIHEKPFENHLMTAKKQSITCEELEEFQLFLIVYTGFNNLSGDCKNIKVDYFNDACKEKERCALSYFIIGVSFWNR